MTDCPNIPAAIHLLPACCMIACFNRLLYDCPKLRERLLASPLLLLCLPLVLQLDAYVSDDSPEAPLNLGGSMLHIRAAFELFKQSMKGGVSGSTGVPGCDAGQGCLIDCLVGCCAHPACNNA
jgi:hypothetical protein